MTKIQYCIFYSALFCTGCIKQFICTEYWLPSDFWIVKKNCDQLQTINENIISITEVQINGVLLYVRILTDQAVKRWMVEEWTMKLMVVKGCREYNLTRFLH